jgi:NtrC-family two-component system sensor histidine kinase KinB
MGYGTTLALMILILIWAFLNLWNLGQASDAILRENYRSILAAENMVYAAVRSGPPNGQPFPGARGCSGID